MALAGRANPCVRLFLKGRDRQSFFWRPSVKFAGWSPDPPERIYIRSGSQAEAALQSPKQSGVGHSKSALARRAVFDRASRLSEVPNTWVCGKKRSMLLYSFQFVSFEKRIRQQGTL
jgi:hypothetical protein